MRRMRRGSWRVQTECPLSGVKRTLLPHRKMSAFDPKRTWASAPHMSAFGGKADTVLASQNVR
jgi:hypothetical protein